MRSGSHHKSWPERGAWAHLTAAILAQEAYKFLQALGSLVLQTHASQVQVLAWPYISLYTSF